MPGTGQNADWDELGRQLRALSPLVDDLHDDGLAPLHREYVRVAEYDLALEVIVALGDAYPEIVDHVTSQLPEQTLRELDSKVIAALKQLARRQG